MDVRHLFSVSLLLIGLVIYLGLKYYYFKKGDATISHYNDSITILKNTEVINSILIALKESKFDEISFDQKQNKFFAFTKNTMSSFGEYLIIEIIHIDESKVKLNFRSQCIYSFQIYAWGKNKKNFEKFESQLNKLIA